MSSGTIRRPRPYQRRRRTPVLIVVAVLAVAAVATWTTVLVNAAGPAGTALCPPPVVGPPPGEPVPADVVNAVPPVPPSSVQVRVLNAGGQRGQANLVAAQLGDLGFGEAAPPNNDPFYPDENLECIGQVRFGPSGEAAASTVALVLPCAELVRDGRTESTVDVAVGTAFGDLNPTRAAQDVLDQLSKGPSGGTDGSANADPNADPNAADAAPAPPAVDPSLLEEAHSASC
jgi:LytR cell envelope-related transcriptional attenuator